MPRIVSHPDSLNVSLNSYASFICSAENVTSVAWYVSDTYIDEVKELDEDTAVAKNGSISTYNTSFLIHEYLDINFLNGSSITCLGYYLIGNGSLILTNYSCPALLLIQG